MADDAAIRRTNLKRLLHARGWTPTEVSARFYGRPSYWRDLLEDPRKSFGEKAARKLEESVGLPRLWLDQPDADLGVAGPAHVLRDTQPSMPPSGWPWSTALWRAVVCLDEDQLEHAEAVLLAHLGLHEQPRDP